MLSSLQNLTTLAVFKDGGYLFPPSRSVPEISENGLRNFKNENVTLLFKSNGSGNKVNRDKSNLIKSMNVRNGIVVKDESISNQGTTKKPRNYGRKKGQGVYQSTGIQQQPIQYEAQGCPEGKKEKSSKGGKMKKYMAPMMVGIFTAKAIILPFIIKSLALLSAKGFALGLFATILASVLLLKKLVEGSGHHDGKKDSVTNIKVIPVPVHEAVHHHEKSHSEHDEEEYQPHHPYRGHY